MIVTVDQIKQIAPNCTSSVAAKIAMYINVDQKECKLDTPNRIAYFLGHCAVESAEFTKFAESLYYSEHRLPKVWPTRFKPRGPANPKDYAKNPQKLANLVYNGRMGNRAGSNDGWMFIGRGMKGVTGRDNVTRFNIWIHQQTFGKNAPDFTNNPEKLEEFPWAFYSAVWYWTTERVYSYADKDDIRGSTKAINGGYIGLDQRTKYINRAKKVIIDQPGLPTVRKEPPKDERDPLLQEYQEKLNKIAKYRDDAKFSVGKADGWKGKKTEAAVKYFQKKTNLNIDGILGPNTREGIDNVLQKLETANVAPLGLLMTTTEASTDQQVVEVPADVPQELESSDTHVSMFKTLWTYVTGFGSLIVSYLSGALDTFKSLDPIVQVAIIFMVTVFVVLGVLAIKDQFKVNKGIQKLKADTIEAIKQTSGVLN